jgi:hypothetical protein
MVTGEIISDGRRLVGTITLDPATGQWVARCTLLHAGFHSCGKHPTKAAAVEAVLCISGELSVYDH